MIFWGDVCFHSLKEVAACREPWLYKSVLPEGSNSWPINVLCLYKCQCHNIRLALVCYSSLESRNAGSYREPAASPVHGNTLTTPEDFDHPPPPLAWREHSQCRFSQLAIACSF